MRIVATSDTHFPFPEHFIPDGDVFLHAGDLMYTGYPDEWEKRLACLERLPHKVKILVPGNHDRHIELYPGPALQELRRAGVTVCGIPGNDKWRSVELPNGMKVLGLPWVTNLPRWSWNREEEWIEEYLEKMGRYDIVVSHSPPRGILDGDYYGVKAYRRYLKRFQPRYWFCGHIHESYGEHIQDGCHFFNVCAMDRNYTTHCNKPVVLDLPDYT